MKRETTQFDERQRLERGRAFQYAYLTALGLLLLLFAVDAFAKDLSVGANTMFLVPFWVSVAVIYAWVIRHDALDGLSDSGPSMLIASLLGVAGLLILGIDLYGLLSGRETWVEEGTLTGLLGSLVGALCQVFIGAFYWLDRRRRRRLPHEE